MPKKQKKLTKKQRVAAIKEKQFNDYYEEFQDSTDKKSKDELGRFLVKMKHKAQQADLKNKDNFIYTIVINVRSTGYNKFGNPFELSDFLSSIAEDFENLPGIISVDLMVGKNEKKRDLVEILCKSDALILGFRTDRIGSDLIQIRSDPIFKKFNPIRSDRIRIGFDSNPI